MALACMMAAGEATSGTERCAGREAGGTAAAQRETPVPKELLERVADAGERFLTAYHSLAAEEILVQTKFNRKGQVETQRRIVSDYAVLRLAGPNGNEVVELRDAVATDGKEIQDAQKRQTKWARLGEAATRAQLSSLFQEAPAHRLFREYFTGLTLLVTRFAARHREKMKFYFAPDSEDSSGKLVVLGYRQASGEGLMSLDGKAVFPNGRAWVDPDSGQIWRIEEWFDGEKSARFRVTLDFSVQHLPGRTVVTRIVVRMSVKGRLDTESEYSYTDHRSIEPAARAGTAP